MRLDTSEWISDASASISSFTRDIAGGVVAEEDEAVEAGMNNFVSYFWQCQIRKSGDPSWVAARHVNILLLGSAIWPVDMHT